MKKNSLKKTIRVSVMFVMVLVMAVSLYACKGKDKKTADAEHPFGEFSTKSISGQEVTQEIFSFSDLTMVNIWGTFCQPCIEEMPDLGVLAGEFGQQSFQMIGVISDVVEPQDEQALAIIEDTGANYEHIIASESLNNNILKNLQGVPTTIFVNKDGVQVGETYLGSRSKEEWKGIIEDMIAQTQP